MPSECADEVKVADRQALSLLTPTESQSLDRVMECEQFSSLHKLLNVTSLVLKFLETFTIITLAKEDPIMLC